mgnify:CR=1 FL=1
MKLFLKIIILNYLIFGLDLKNEPLLKNWTLIQDKPVRVEWIDYKGFPISRAEKILDHDMISIAEIIQDLDRYPSIFKRVTSTKKIGQDIVQVVLNMPFPFARRDYVVQYDIEQGSDYWIFYFSSVEHNQGKLKKGDVRLPNAAGIWFLKRITKDKTLVKYTWNGELLGNFPNFGLTKAWITQGTEVLNWLDEAIDNGIES